MSIKIDKKAYEKLIKGDLDFLDEHCPDGPRIDPVRMIACSLVDWNYLNKSTGTALKRIDNRIRAEFQKHKDAGKQFISAQEIYDLIDNIRKEEQQLQQEQS